MHIRETMANVAGFGSPDQLARSIAQLRRTVEYLQSECPESRGEKTACLGEGLSALLACEEPGLSGAAVFYGNTPSADKLARVHCPLIAFYGGKDARTNARIASLAEGLRSAGSSFEYHVYEGADHGFFNDAVGNHDIRASRDAFARLVSFLLRTLTSGGG